MWFNGFMVVIDMALESLGDARLLAQRDALVLGAFREDVCFSGFGIVSPSPSLTHFSRAGLPGGFIPFVCPGAPQRARKFFDRALAEAARGRETAAFVQLGRAIHPLGDMACPVHAQGVAHKVDPFEWCVEARHAELRRLPVPRVALGGVEAIVEDLACLGQSFRADKTTSPWGAVMRRLGWRRPVLTAEAREQATALIPRAAGCTAALLGLFTAKVEYGAGARPRCEDLEMSPTGLLSWLAQLEAFCRTHGGKRHYGGLLDLIGRCRAPS